MEEAASRPASNNIAIVALILGALGLAMLLFVPLISAALGLGAIVVGAIAFSQTRTGALHRPIAIVAVITGTVLILSIIAFTLLAGVLFMDSPGRPEVGAGEPLAQTHPEGDYVIELMETRYYKTGREIERTGFALIIVSQQPFPRPGPDETFIYLDITLKNESDAEIVFAPMSQFWLVEESGKRIDIPVYVLPEEYGDLVSVADVQPGEVITLPAKSEMPILFETVVDQDAPGIVMVFDPDLALTGDDVLVAVPR